MASTTRADKSMSVLLIGACQERHKALRNIFAIPAWEIHEAASYGEALGILNDRGIGVTICDAEMDEGGGWQALLADLQSRVNPPNLIVSSRLADERLWAEVLNLGGYDVLVQPFDRGEVLRVARMAWMRWCQEYQDRTAAAC